VGFIDPWLYPDRGAGLTASGLPGQVQHGGLHVLQQVHHSYTQGFILYLVGLMGCRRCLKLNSIIRIACMLDSQRYPVNLCQGKTEEGVFVFLSEN